jgi:XisH protein.
MPAKDVYHDAVVRALIRDGWTITHDPLTIRWGTRDLFVDLGAERLLAAERGEEKIAVEIKSFLSPSEMSDLKEAFGQYIMHHDILEETDPERPSIWPCVMRPATQFSTSR